MATLNPLEQKAHSAFIKGFIIAILIGIVGCGILGVQIYKMNGEKAQEEAKKKSVMVLTQDVSSGELITSEMLKTVSIDQSGVQAAAINSYTQLSSYFAYDINGNKITTEDDDESTTTNNNTNSTNNSATNTNTTTNTEKNNKTATKSKYIYIATESGEQNNGRYKLQEDENGKYYYVDSQNQTQYVTLADTALVAKIDLGKNTIISANMFTESNEQTKDDMREQEFNMILLPTNLADNDIIDVRLRLPDGTDYIVLSKKRARTQTGLAKEEDSTTSSAIKTSDYSNTVLLNVTEDEILTINAAIVDAYQITGCKLYAIKYTEPGIQKAATATYIPSRATLELIQNDPNIVTEAKNSLITFYNENYAKYRTSIQNAVESSGESDELKSSIESKTSSEITTQQGERSTYLQSLEGGAE